MKFRFCGDGDCPDWVLAEIISTLSMLSARNLEQLAMLVAKRIVGEAFEEDAIKSLCSSVSNDGKTAIACIHYLLINAARHNVNETIFGEEIQQLGLPKDHAAAMCRVLSANAEQIRQQLIKKAFKINELSSVKCIPVHDDNLDCIRLELSIAQQLVDGLPQDTTHVVNIDRANAKAMLAELKQAYGIMEKYELNNMDNVDK